MVIDYVLIGKRIRKARKIKNWSQEILAEKINVTPGYLSRVENGAKVSLELLVNIAFHTEQDPGWFLTGCSYHLTGKNEMEEILAACTPKQVHMIMEIIKVICQKP